MSARKRFIITLVVASVLFILLAMGLGVASWYRSFKSMVTFKAQEVLVLRADNATGSFRAPRGKQFFFVLGIPKLAQGNHTSFVGQISVSSGETAAFNSLFDEKNVTRASWLDDRGFDAWVIKFKAGQGPSLLPGHDYTITATSSNLVGCSIWIHYAARIAEPFEK